MNKPQIFFEAEGSEAGGGTATPAPAAGDKTFTQDDVNNIVAKATKGLKEQFGDYETLKAEKEKLAAEKEEREQQEMSDLEKANKSLEDKDLEIKNLSTYKDRVEKFEASQKEKVEKEIEGFSEEDKDLVLSLPLEKQMAMVGKLKTSSGAPESAGRQPGGNGVNKTMEEILAMPDGPEKTAAYRKYRRG